MTTSAWEPSTAYALADLVSARSSGTVVTDPLTNADFEAGAGGWTAGANWTAGSAAGTQYQGTKKGQRTGAAGTSRLTNTKQPTCVPGQLVKVSGVISTLGTSASGKIGVSFQTAASVVLKEYESDAITNSGGVWKRVEAEGYAPAGTEKVVMYFTATATASGDITDVDAASWNYARKEIPAPFIYEATVAGVSGLTEPTWPTVAGGTVVDGGVTWTARAASRVTWTAKPIYQTGATEPVWPTTPDGMVADGTIGWEATARDIKDERCPHTRAVTITASKVWAVDDDIVRYSATVNAKDWTSANDAGYLPTGLKQYGDNSTDVLGIYRGNLVAMSASTFQMWEVDEDPANNNIVDEMQGVGSIYYLAATPVSNDLFFLTAQGVRTVGIAAGSTNLEAGDVGMPIDPLVKAAMQDSAAQGYEPRSFYLPGAGQYWLCFSVAADTTLVFVYTMNRIGQVGAWGRYEFPFVIEDVAQLNDEIYIRGSDNAVRVLSAEVNYDETPTGGAHAKNYYDGVVHWPYLDCGQVGRDKEMAGFDIVGTGTPTIEIGYDQAGQALYTPAYEVDPDTLTGDIIGMPMVAPTFSPKITYVGAEGNFWELQQVILYFTR